MTDEEAEAITDAEIEREIRQKLTVPLWPHAGRALGLKRNATYAAAESKNPETPPETPPEITSKLRIPTIDVSRKRNVPTSWLRQKLGLNSKPPDPGEPPSWAAFVHRRRSAAPAAGVTKAAPEHPTVLPLEKADRRSSKRSKLRCQ